MLQVHKTSTSQAWSMAVSYTHYGFNVLITASEETHDQVHNFFYTQCKSIS